MAVSPSKVILVVGHGVAGKLTSAALAKAGGARILVVESREFWEADVMSPVLLSRPEAYAKFSGGQAVARLPGVSYVQGVVTRLDRLEGGRYGVGLATGEMLKVDAVVLAVGSTLPLLKPAVGATRMERDAELASARKAIGEAQTILIGGGGSVGVEIAGAVAELKQPSAKVTLVVSGATVLSDGFPSGTRERLAAHMRSKGVEIVPNEKVVSPQPLSFADRKATYTLSSGKTLEADCFLPGFCSFSVPFMAAHKGAVDARGKIVVDAALQSVVLPGVFAVACSTGDGMLNMPEIQAQAKSVAQNALAFLAGAPLAPRAVPGGPKFEAEPWVHFQWGAYSLLNLPGPMAACARCCGWPFPCFCCCPGCCMPCGFSCCPPEGQGPGQFFQTMMFSLKGPPVMDILGKPGIPTAPTPAAMAERELM